MDAAIPLSVASLIIALAGFVRTMAISRPKIGGRVFNVTTEKAVFSGKSCTYYLAFLHLNNGRENGVTILDYAMEVEIDDEWHALDRVYGIHSGSRFVFAVDGATTEFPPYAAEQMIYLSQTPIDYGHPLQGFLFFTGDDSFVGRASAYRVICTDELNRQHTITTKVSEFGNPMRMLELTGMMEPRRGSASRITIGHASH